MSKALTRAIEAHRKTAAEMSRILKRDYPEGAPITWNRNGVHTGAVVMNSGTGPRIKVRSGKSGKEYWIYCQDIVL